MEETKHILFVPNSAEKPVNASILTRKLAQTATQQGYTATVAQSLEDEAISTAQQVIIVGDKPTNTKMIEQKTVSIVSLDVAQSNTKDILAHALSTATTADQLATTATGATRFVAITACPTGVAHTFMAAEALQQGAKKHGYEIQIETQGSVGAKNILTAESISQADIVILATDIEVNTDRFVGKRVYRCATGFALKQTDKAFENAVKEATVLDSGKQSTTKAQDEKKEQAGLYKHLLTGISYMLPMVVAGGLILAISLVFGIHPVDGSLGANLAMIGKTAMMLMVPMLSGYIAYSIADRPGLTPGLIGGLLASGPLGAGFLGGIASGFIAGYIALFLAKKLKLPQSVESLKPILIIPLLASLVTGLLMVYVVGTPVAYLFEMLKTFLTGMGSTNAVLMGMVIAGMMCIDLGGPINKAAYAVAIGLFTTNHYMPIAAAMAGGMVPPLGMAIATFLAKAKFEQAERDTGKASFVLGLCFVSEGAISFAAKDPKRVIPSCILGGLLTGALVAYLNCELKTAHGGIFVLLIPNAMNHAGAYLLAICAGSVLTGITYALLKQKQPELVAEKA
ncbi:PTS transporter subunit EIIC [Acinetobacter sp. B5B]|uniref:fructose-specific PTS transporter subunit EIIC n=1 Tax=Acinetobacter baretiae TaxID=2605383 RepID=UPI0018C21159|nr:fructose-specific PTS transporter subunit EIIC [Acinetobacter baretiae]MBF7683434.1 PTS transporter subunit EIIC [Acinetobacter baretiae]MBF7685801.1 PTS transporter subunit EIIC [Acinetobacter baretiae]